MTGLFSDADGKEYSAEDIRTALHEVGAHDCDALFVHSDVMFGKPAAGFRRREYLNTLYQLVQDLHVAVLVPTFTYSFCNHEDYDVRTSKTSMGAFSEYVRNLDGRYRTLDPLLSVSVPVELKAKFENVGPNSLGVNSGLDALHGIGGGKVPFPGR